MTRPFPSKPRQTWDVIHLLRTRSTIHIFASVSSSMTRSRSSPSANEACGSANACAVRSTAGRAQKRRKRSKPNNLPHTELLYLSEDVLADGIITRLSARELCVLGCCSRMFHVLTGVDPLWKRLFEETFNGSKPTSRTQCRAAVLARSWKLFFHCKAQTIRENHERANEQVPWETPCKFELDVALERLPAQCTAAAPALSVVFLVDGSGSVTEEDFVTMTQLLSSAAECIAAKHPEPKVAVVQFSNDVRVELPLQTLDCDSFHETVASMARMNGGTCIAAAIQKAGQILKGVDYPADEDEEYPDGDAEDAAWGAAYAAAPALPADAGTMAEAQPGARVLVLLTDGRLDSYQAREAVSMARRLADEQANVSLFAFGVGRGADKDFMMHMIGATSPGVAVEERYTGLKYTNEALW